jgi:AcrR family transcriptional regulator
MATGAHAREGIRSAEDIAGDDNKPSAHEQMSAIQRARVLAALVDASAERGAANVTVAHIVARAGVSRRTFYELFADRETCFLAAFDDAVARATACVLGAYDRSAPWPRRMRAAVTAGLAFLEADPRAARLLMVDSLGAGAKTLEHRRLMQERIVEAVEQGREQVRPGSAPPPLAGEGAVGGLLSVLHSRLLAPRDGGLDPDGAVGLVELSGQLTGMLLLPYLGIAAAQREQARPAPALEPHASAHSYAAPLPRLDMRLTYRTVRVLAAVASLCHDGPPPSNRAVADASGISDQGQISKLLARLQTLGLIANSGKGPARGEPNAWSLTDEGHHVQHALAARGGAINPR